MALHHASSSELAPRYVCVATADDKITDSAEPLLLYADLCHEVVQNAALSASTVISAVTETVTTVQ